VIRALGENGIEGVIVAGQDADIAACQRIVTGKQTMTVYKPITVLAKKAAKYACAFARDRNYEPDVADDETLTTINNGTRDVPMIILKPVPVTKKNMDTVIIASGFHTRDEVYEPD
jgi:D-xylose transport system substrate-binding protein